MGLKLLEQCRSGIAKLTDLVPSSAKRRQSKKEEQRQT
jgi:hypothetical protein